MRTRFVVLGVVGAFLSVISLSMACDPLPDQCDESRCDGNTAVDCQTSPDMHSIEVESACPADTKCFVEVNTSTDENVHCGRLQPDGTACAPVGGKSCAGDAIRTCTAAKDGKAYWLDIKCSEYIGRSGTCTSKPDGSDPVCS